MNQTQAQKFIEILEKIRKASPKVESLYQDVLGTYYPKIGKPEMPEACAEVWDASLFARLQNIPPPPGTATDFARAMAYLPKAMGDAIPSIHFGQIRIGWSFQGSMTVNQQTIVGFPQDKVVGRPLTVVAGMMVQAEIGADEIPVQIFRDAKTKLWIAANNRGYATHCMAGKRPLRVWPRLPDQMEINRLAEVEGQGDAKTFTYAAGVIARLQKKPHSLPSRQIPLTAGPNSWEVLAIAEVP